MYSFTSVVLTLNMIVFGHGMFGLGKDKFEIELIHLLEDRMDVDLQAMDLPFYKENGDDKARRSLCTSAKEDAQLDGMSPNFTDYSVTQYLVVYPKLPISSRQIHAAMKCETIPTVWIRPGGNSDAKYTIMMRENDFLAAPYTFIPTETVDTDPVSYMIDSDEKDASEWYKKLQENFLSKLLSYERVHICVAAKRSLQTQHDGRQLIPVLQDPDVSEADLYDFPDGIGREVAINCESSPGMYVYLGTKFDSDVRVFRVTLVKAKN